MGNDRRRPARGGRAAAALAVAAAAAMTAAAPDAARAAPLPEGVRETRAPNGLRIITREAFAKDLVALNLYVDGGNRTEPRELSGLSHYYEHLIFRGGTAKQKELETRKAFETLGEFRGWTHTDTTCYWFVVPAARFDEALDRFADAVLYVEVTAEKVAKEREVVISEYKMSRVDLPSGWGWWNLFRTAFLRHPYGRTTLGLREVIEGADLARFKTFHAERYVPNHMVAAVVGAIPHEVAAAKVAAAFARREPGKPSFETGETEPEQRALRVVIEGRKSEKSYGALAFKAPAWRDADTYALSVLAQVLGGGESSRLEREVRARKGLVLEASAWTLETRDPGLIGVAFTADPGKEVAAIEAVLAECARLRSEEVPARELERAKVKLETDWLFANESYQAQADRLCWFALMGDPSLGAEHLARLRAVTAADVREAARRRLDPRALTVSLVQPDSGPLATSEQIEGAVAAAWGAPASPAGEAAAPPASGAAPARTVARRAPAGTTVIAREDRSTPIVAAVLRFAGPLEAEPRDRPGLAAVADRLLTRGAKGLSREEFAARLDDLGVRLGTGVDHDALTASLEAPADRFEAGLDLLAAALLEPAFGAAEIEKARTEQVAAIQAVDDDSFALVAREHYSALYGAEGYGRPVEGAVEGVRAVAREDLVAWRAAVVRPERLVVAVVGAIDPGAAIAAVEGRFALAPPVTSTAQAAPDAEPPPSAPPAPRLVRKPREQVCFRLGHIGIPATHPDWIPLALAIRHLASDVFFRFVYENGMAYRAWTHLRSGRRAHPFTFEMGVSAPNFRAAREGLETALRGLVERGLTEADLEKAKKELCARHLLNQQTNLGQASLLAQYESTGVGWRRLDDLPGLVARATLDEVNAALRRHLRPGRLTLAVVGDLEAARLR